MASIESLLNPAPELARLSLPSPTLSSSPSTVDSQTPRQKKQKLTKDAPVFTRGKIRGELRYPPCEERDEELTRLHREFQIHPLDSIAEYPRHIPYNSDKKSFQDRTGRESFEVFQYTFKIPGEDKEWTVMWDYNIGLVRTTHLFKCNDYSKTTPAKMLNANPGLRDICHSITGGALAAQGYWMPFEAAKAVSATFCWKIRYALTPLFGLDFPSLCVHPRDRALYGRMIIDSSVVRKATETANFYQMLELRRTPVSSVASDPPRSSPYDRPQIQPRKYPTSVGTSVGSMTPEYADSFCVSPVSSYRNSFTPVNTPRSALRLSPQDIPRSVSTLSVSVSEDKADESESDESDGTKSNSNSNSASSLYSDPSSSSYSSSSTSSSSASTSTTSSTESNPLSITHGTPETDNIYLPQLPQKLTRSRRHRHSRSRSRSHHRTRNPTISKSNKPRGPSTGTGAGTRTTQFAREVKAAHALLSLYMQDTPADEMDECDTAGEHDVRSQTPNTNSFVTGNGFGNGSGRKRRRASA